MSSDRIDELRKTVERYKKALAYLDASTPFTYQKFVETHRIAGIAMSESEMRHKWDMSEMMIEGTEGLRQVLRDSLIDAINTLEPLIGQLARAGTSQQILPTQMTKKTNDKASCSWLSLGILSVSVSLPLLIILFLLPFILPSVAQPDDLFLLPFLLPSVPPEEVGGVPIGYALAVFFLIAGFLSIAFRNDLARWETQGISLKPSDRIDEFRKVKFWALMSFILSLLSFLGGLLTGVPAVMLGFIALRKIAASEGQTKWKEIAWLGIILGFVLTVISIFLSLVALLSDTSVQ